MQHSQASVFSKGCPKARCLCMSRAWKPGKTVQVLNCGKIVAAEAAGIDRGAAVSFKQHLTQANVCVVQHLQAVAWKAGLLGPTTLRGDSSAVSGQVTSQHQCCSVSQRRCRSPGVSAAVGRRLDPTHIWPQTHPRRSEPQCLPWPVFLVDSQWHPGPAE